MNQHYNENKQGTHLAGTDNRCNLCLEGGITLFGGEIMWKHNREKLIKKYRDTGTKPSEVIISKTYN